MSSDEKMYSYMITKLQVPSIFHHCESSIFFYLCQFVSVIFKKELFNYAMTLVLLVEWHFYVNIRLNIWYWTSMIYHFLSKHNTMLSTHMLKGVFTDVLILIKLLQWKIIWIVRLYQFLYCFMDNWSNMSKQNAEFPRNIIYFDVTRKIGIKHSAKCIFLTCHLIVQTLPCNFSILFQPHAQRSVFNKKWKMVL